MRRFILDSNGEPVAEPDLLTWAQWIEDHDQERIVLQSTVGDITISTVFLGLDHNWKQKGKPLIYETMIFGGSHNYYTKRYSTKEEAETGHAAAVGLVAAEDLVTRAKST